MILRTTHREFVVCPHCRKKHGECLDWVKSMPHREMCSCGKEFLCWFETETAYFAEPIEAGEQPKLKKKKKKKDKGKKKKGKKGKRRD
jgi:hypothetical protein